MAGEDGANAPKVVVVRREVYDPSLEKYVNDELPTVTVTRARIRSSMTANGAMASHYVGSGTAATGAGTVGYGSVARLVYLNIFTTAAQTFYMKDRKGTIGFHNFIAAGEKTIQGDSKKPIRVVEGTFVIAGLGSLTSGTYTVDFELVKRSQKW